MEALGLARSVIQARKGLHRNASKKDPCPEQVGHNGHNSASPLGMADNDQDW